MRTKTDTKERLFAAAEKLFCERGFAGASAADVAGAVGCNKRLVFYYFESMEKLYEAVLDSYYEAHRAALSAAFEAPGAPAVRFQRVIEAYFDFIDENRGYPRLVQAEIGAGGTGLFAIKQGLIHLHAWMEHALGPALPKKGPLSPKHFFLSFSGMVINYFTYAPALEVMWGSDPLSAAGRAERKEHLNWMVQTLVRAIMRTGIQRRRR